MSADWFSAHKQGLRQIAERLVERRGFGIIGAELYQNSMDTTATECRISIKMAERKRATAILMVEDNGEGFHDLSHAYTMFAPSLKKQDPEKAGRFNMGEKMVLSFCRWARITTTSGTITFDESGRDENKRATLSRGTLFAAEIDCDRFRLEQFVEHMNKIIVRPGLTLFVNDQEVQRRTPIHTFEIALKTEIGDDLRPTVRKTVVEVYEPIGHQVAVFKVSQPMLHELGIPVVELPDDRYDISVKQKVPLNVDRDNVTPAYLRDVRVAVFNEMHHRLTADDMQTQWVAEATSDERCHDKAITDFMTKKFGEKRTQFDPSDIEANKRAAFEGFTVIPPRGLNATQRENAKRAGALAPSGQLFATPKPFHKDGKPVEIIPVDQWTVGMVKTVRYVQWLASQLIEKDIDVLIVRRLSERISACYGPGGPMYFSLNSLGHAWFNLPLNDPDKEELIVHELGHEFEADHLSRAYNDSQTKLGVRFKNLALNKREELLQWYEGGK